MNDSLLAVLIKHGYAPRNNQRGLIHAFSDASRVHLDLDRLVLKGASGQHKPFFDARFDGDIRDPRVLDPALVAFRGWLDQGETRPGTFPIGDQFILGPVADPLWSKDLLALPYQACNASFTRRGRAQSHWIVTLVHEGVALNCLRQHQAYTSQHCVDTMSIQLKAHPDLDAKALQAMPFLATNVPLVPTSDPESTFIARVIASLQTCFAHWVSEPEFVLGIGRELLDLGGDTFDVYEADGADHHGLMVEPLDPPLAPYPLDLPCWSAKMRYRMRAERYGIWAHEPILRVCLPTSAHERLQWLKSFRPADLGPFSPA